MPTITKNKSTTIISTEKRRSLRQHSLHEEKSSLGCVEACSSMVMKDAPSA